MFLKRNNSVEGRSLLAHQPSLCSASHLSACSRFLGKHPCFPFWPSFPLQWHMLSVPCPPLAWRTTELEWHHLCSRRAHFQFLTSTPLLYHCPCISSQRCWFGDLAQPFLGITSVGLATPMAADTDLATPWPGHPIMAYDSAWHGKKAASPTCRRTLVEL